MGKCPLRVKMPLQCPQMPSNNNSVAIDNEGKYYRNWSYLLAGVWVQQQYQIMVWIMGYLFHFSSLFGWNYIQNQLENPGLKSRLVYCLRFQYVCIYLMYQLMICQKPAHFWSAQMAVLNSFFFSVYSTLDV